MTLRFEAGGSGLASFDYTISDGSTTTTGTVSVQVVDANNGYDLSGAGSYQASSLDFDNNHDAGTGAGGLNIFVGGSGNDTLIGGDGNDVLRGGTGDDKLDGQGGIDLIDFSDGSAGTTFTLV